MLLFFLFLRFFRFFEEPFEDNFGSKIAPLLVVNASVWRHHDGMLVPLAVCCEEVVDLKVGSNIRLMWVGLELRHQTLKMSEQWVTQLMQDQAHSLHL